MARKKQAVTDVAGATVYNPNAVRKEGKDAAPAADVVTVALCHPHGITFRLGDRDVTLNGNAADLKGLSMGTLPVGGFGLTTIAKADWEAIRRIVQDWALFRNGLLFAHDKPADVTAEADEKAELRHGREPVEVNGGTRQSQSVPADMASA